MRILIADDHRVVRTGLRMLLESHPDFEVVGEASSGPETVQKAQELRPELVILDLSMPDGNGLLYLRQLSEMTRVLVLTMHDDPAYVRQVIQAGGSGYVLKEAADVELFSAIRAVLSGQTYIYPTLAAKLVEEKAGGERKSVPLSPRELEVLRLVALGHTNQEIALQLNVSVRTVETYKTRICEKLGVYTRSEMVRYALEHKLT
ncbi:response regulator transcription factor [Symbiobacterium thermophilum]|uniref:Stage 0 sporulation protein A homolog n=2 Tax=Symbiobacterium thermophilum TaxID=2734 RepID=Q67JE8_SYMTH|nr:response regulator transcription factor [Symbiobacterium thermophilum]MBY6278196.1 DNA-binding response regulator [Symbiobacterium thermophilum]BAD42202.1 two-component response regulator [Symbiobacterium thermophilum IAM 14863]